MKKLIILSMITILLCGTVFAQQNDVAAKTEHAKAAKHARKKKHRRENGTVDAPREAKAVNSVKNAPRLQTQPGSAAF